MRFRVKKLDFLGMKYTSAISGILTLLLATFASVAPSLAQSAYVSGAPSLDAYNAPANGSDDPQSSVITTIRARVNEVNVLFIATDKHGKFVRDLTQKDFTILDDHKPPQAILNFR